MIIAWNSSKNDEFLLLKSKFCTSKHLCETYYKIRDNDRDTNSQLFFIVLSTYYKCIAGHWYNEFSWIFFWCKINAVLNKKGSFLSLYYQNNDWNTFLCKSVFVQHSPNDIICKQMSDNCQKCQRLTIRNVMVTRCPAPLSAT